MKESLASRSTLGSEKKNLLFKGKESTPTGLKTSINTLDQLIAEIERSLRIKANLSGYLYIRTAVTISLSNPNVTVSVTKLLYPDVAKKHCTTSQRVERGIRTAIEKSWYDGDVELQQRIFGYSLTSKQKRPTNSQYIASIVDYIHTYYPEFL